MLQRFKQQSGQVLVVGSVRLLTREQMASVRKMSAYSIDYSAIPANLDLSAKSETVLRMMMLNGPSNNPKFPNGLGDCLIRCQNVIEGIAVDNAGGSYAPTDDNIIADYSGGCGFNPNDPANTDNGCDPSSALPYFQKTGYSANGGKIAGWVQIDNTNLLEVAAAIFLFGCGINICTGLPDPWLTAVQNGNFADGFTWGIVPGGSDPNNGHSYPGYGYKSDPVCSWLSQLSPGQIINFLVNTWGFNGTQTGPAVQQYSQIYMPITPDVVAHGAANAPNGLDWAQMVSDFDVDFGGTVPPVGPPTPVNPPIPPDPGPAPAPSDLGSRVSAIEQWIEDTQEYAMGAPFFQPPSGK